MILFPPLCDDNFLLIYDLLLLLPLLLTKSIVLILDLFYGDFSFSILITDFDNTNDLLLLLLLLLLLFFPLSVFPIELLLLFFNAKTNFFSYYCFFFIPVFA